MFPAGKSFTVEMKMMKTIYRKIDFMNDDEIMTASEFEVNAKRLRKSHNNCIEVIN